MIAVIGIDRYQHWKPLSNAVRDARGAAALFKQLGFEELTEPLIDEAATERALQSLVTDELKMLGPDDSLVLFYAGHGSTQEHALGDQLIKTGYLIPVDAQDKVVTWIDLEGWLRAVSRLPAKHILVVLDTCHGGIALDPVIRWRNDDSAKKTPLATLCQRRSRRIITSALADQLALDSGPVHGHSLFTGCLIDGLTYDLSRSGSQVITGSELGLYLQRRVGTYPNAKQTPDFGAFDFDDRGELVIPLLHEQPRTSRAAHEQSPASRPVPQLVLEAVNQTKLTAATLPVAMPASVEPSDLPQTLRLRPGRLKTLLLVWGALALTAGGVVMIRNNVDGGWLCMIFFGLCSLVFVMLLLPSTAYLQLTPESFEVRSLFRSWRLNWTDVGTFRAGHIGLNPMVGFDFSRTYKRIPKARVLASVLAGVEGVLPDTYGLGAKKLAKLLNEWRDRAYT